MEKTYSIVYNNTAYNVYESHGVMQRFFFYKEPFLFKITKKIFFINTIFTVDATNYN